MSSHRHIPAWLQNINKTRCFAAKQKRWTTSKKLRVIAVTSSSEYPEDCRVGAIAYLEKADYKIWSDIRIVAGLGNIISSHHLAGEHPRHNTCEPEMF